MYANTSSTPNSVDRLARFRCAIDPDKINAASSSERDAINQYAFMIAGWRADLSEVEEKIAMSDEGYIKSGHVRHSTELRRLIGALYPIVRPYQH